MRALIFALALIGAAGCCGTQAPEQVTTALQNQLEDLAILEAGPPGEGMLAYVPDDLELTADFGGKLYQVREGWKRRIRGLMLRTLSLQAWARHEEFDVVTAMKKLELLPPEDPE
jgi:hypothetical protein